MKITQTINSCLAIFYKEYKIIFQNFYDVLSIILFFLLGVLIFVFSIGPNELLLNQVGVGVIWTLLLLSTNLSIKKFYQDDFNDGNIFLLHMSGLSFEFIVLIKLLALWVLFQLPFLIIIPVACLILSIQNENIYLILTTFFLGSPVLTMLASISGSMNLLNNKNFAIGSVIVMIFSIPLIVFSVGIISAPSELIKSQLYILAGILLLFLALTPWVSAGCIRIALRHK